MSNALKNTLVLVRHGESTWNLENRFTGWVDVGLSPKGVEEAHAAGRLLKAEGFALRPLLHVAPQAGDPHAADRPRGARPEWLPVERSWRLNERHYGALQGLNKKETAQKYGEEQLFAWRRGYAVTPPPLSTDDASHPRFDPRYRSLPPEILPSTESLALVVDRFLPYWYDAIVPRLARGEDVIVAAHGNSLRALVKHLDGISDDGHPGAEHPDGDPARLHAGRVVPEGREPLPRRPRGREEGGRSRREAGEGLRALLLSARAPARSTSRPGRAQAARRRASRTRSSRRVGGIRAWRMSSQGFAWSFAQPSKLLSRSRTPRTVEVLEVRPSATRRRRSRSSSRSI